MQSLVLVLVMLMVFSASSQHVYYVKTDASPSSACPVQPCLTLDQYSSQASTYFTTGATFMFLTGNHTILTPIILKNVSHVAFMGEEADSVTVFYKRQCALQCDKVTNLTIEGLTFVLDADDQDPLTTTFVIFYSRGILFTNLTFRGNLDLYNRAVYCNQSEVTIVSCLFTGCTAIDGGAVLAYRSNISLDGSVFIQNWAIKTGGAIYADKSFLLLKETPGNTFASNSAFEGGAILCFDSSIVIERDTVTKSSLDEKKVADSYDTKCGCINVPLERCGPLPVHQPHVHTTYFSNNKAKHGGAIFMLNNSEAFLNGTSIIFHNNSAIALTVENWTLPEYRIQHHSGLLKYNIRLNNWGGAIDVQDSILSLSGMDIIFHENFARGAGGAGGAVFSWYSTVTSNTKHLCFARNIADMGGAYFNNMYRTQISTGQVLFVNNHADNGGGGIFVYFFTLLFSGPAIDFVNNSAAGDGGGVFLENSHLYITAAEVNFVENKAKSTGGGIIAFTSVISGTKQLNFIGNSAFEGAAGLNIHRCDCRLLSANFIKNAGGPGAIFARNSNVSLHDANVTGNTGRLVGAIDVSGSNVTFSGDIKISRNTADFGSGINAMKSLITFKGNTVFEENSSKEGSGGAIWIRLETTMSFSGYVLFKANSANEGGAIFASDRSTSITFADEVHFTANRARNGGAMYFDNSASMIIKKNVKLTSTNNSATEHGGAIYNRDVATRTQCDYSMTEAEDRNVGLLPSCFIDTSDHNGTNFPYEIISHNDSAKQNGSFLYGGLLDKCIVQLEDITTLIFYTVFVENILNASSGDSHSKLITSEAYLLCFCESSEQYNCTLPRSVETYRGRKFTVPLLALAEGNTVTSTPLRAKLSPTARLLPNQRSQYLSSHCTNMSYNLYSSEEQEQLIVYPDDGPCLDTGLARAVINVTFLPCPDAFTLSGDQCVCEKRLQAVEANCKISDDDFYITRKAGSKFWVSALTSNGTYHGLILCQSCPVMYCKTESVNISLDEPDVQCDHNRSSILCGACVANYSLMLGSSICQACSNTHLALLFPFAAAGIALVVFLSLLRLTVATGMINSIILYANIVQANRNLLFPTFTGTNVLTVFIAWMNLDLGFQTCFFHGMDAYAQTWLQFAFPVYVWIIIACMIVTSRLSITVTNRH